MLQPKGLCLLSAPDLERGLVVVRIFIWPDGPLISVRVRVRHVEVENYIQENRGSIRVNPNTEPPLSFRTTIQPSLW